MRRQLVVIGSVTLGLAAGAWAADLHVPSQYGTIQAAIDAAKDSDTVWVANGTYSGPGNRDISFGGKAITVRSVSGPKTCIIDCDGTLKNPHRGFQFSNQEGRDSVLEGFTITDGHTLQGAVEDRFNGAGILVTQQSSPTLRNLVITGNWAGCWGGAICCSFKSHPLIDSCELSDNYTDDDGGGVFAWNGSAPKIVNTIIKNNVASVVGGGIVALDGNIEIVNSTIVDNSASFATGVYGTSQTTLVNSIVWSKKDGDRQVQGNPIITYSLVKGGYAGEGNTTKDPKFVGEKKGNYRLAANSPLIDKGDPKFAPKPTDQDADGNPRFVGARVDMGAFEFQGTACRADFDGSNGVDFSDLVQLLARWGTCGDCIEDIDDDGIVDFSDLLAILAQWGPCP